MNREIGSDFWLEKIPMKQHLEIPIWLKKYGNTVLTSSGRGAITLLLEQVNPTNKTVLLPEYICDSVIAPFRAHGYTCHFYEVKKDLSPNLESIMSIKNLGLFLHMGYFGFDTNSNLTSVLQELKKQSTIIVEDVTHTLFSNINRFTENDYYVASIRKWFGVPSGGLLASTKANLKEPVGINTDFASLREKALLLKGNYMKSGNEDLKKLYLQQFNDAEQLLEDMKCYQIDPLSLTLLNSLDVDYLVNKRRQNYQVLLDGLSDLNYLSTPVKDLKDDMCPIFFVVNINKDRDLIRKKLIDEKIYCPIHWPIPKQLCEQISTETKDIYYTTISIPCDQRNNIEDMKHIISVIINLEK
ncbi:hypothetical protein UACE39S_05380 [Ureibacillus acetophenoni]